MRGSGKLFWSVPMIGYPGIFSESGDYYKKTTPSEPSGGELKSFLQRRTHWRRLTKNKVGGLHGKQVIEMTTRSYG